METEPISVRIARLRGCEPVHVSGGTLTREQWRCQCRVGHGPIPSLATLWTDLGFEGWTEPAASFALLAEMVEGGGYVAVYRNTAPLSYHADEYQGDQMSEAPTLGEAIALAYEAWATAKGARQ